MGVECQDCVAHSRSGEWKRWPATTCPDQAYCGLHLPHLVGVVEIMYSRKSLQSPEMAGPPLIVHNPCISLYCSVPGAVENQTY